MIARNRQRVVELDLNSRHGRQLPNPWLDTASGGQQLDEVGQQFDEAWRWYLAKQWDEVQRCLARVLELDPRNLVAHRASAEALTRLGRTTDAEAEHRYMLDHSPSPLHRRTAREALIFLLDHEPATTNAAALAARQEWWGVEGLPRAARRTRVHTNDRTLDRPLRVGYLSSDIRHHSASYVFAPVLRQHDPAAVDVVLYDTTPPDTRDARSVQLRASIATVRDVYFPYGGNDEALAASILADRIDILVDLSGFSAPWLPAFCLTPAPIQVTAWGYALGTGLPVMDYFLADAFTVPPDQRQFFAEEVVDLPCIVPYDGVPNAPEPNALPALSPGEPFRFGSFSRVAKLNGPTFDLWASVLRTVPDSTLFLKEGSLATVRSWIGREFAARGVDPRRIRVQGFTDHLTHVSRYHDIDLALDPTPHGGGVTALEGLWMGVPPVTLLGERIVSRLSGSFLEKLGLDEFICPTLEAYVQTAQRWASTEGRQELATVRAGLRHRMRTAPFFGPSYVRAVEERYRWMFHRWIVDGGKESGAARSRVSTRAGRAVARTGG